MGAKKKEIVSEKEKTSKTPQPSANKNMTLKKEKDPAENFLL